MKEVPYCPRLYMRAKFSPQSKHKTTMLNPNTLAGQYALAQSGLNSWEWEDCRLNLPQQWRVECGVKMGNSLTRELVLHKLIAFIGGAEWVRQGAFNAKQDGIQAMLEFIFG